MQTARSRRGGSASAAAIERAERERKAIALRQQGYSFDEIAVELGFSDRSGARKAVERGLSRWMRETDEEFRARELERTEMMIDRLWPLIDRDDPDLKAMDRLHRLMDYRAKIMGLYAKRPTVPDTYPGAPHRAAVDKGEMVVKYSELADKVYKSGYAAGVAAARYGDDYEDDDEMGAGPFDSDDAAGQIDDEHDVLEPMDWVDGKPVWNGRWIDGKLMASDRSDPGAESELKHAKPAAPVAEALKM